MIQQDHCRHMLVDNNVGMVLELVYLVVSDQIGSFLVRPAALRVQSWLRMGFFGVWVCFKT
jgi:hypothetical protein